MASAALLRCSSMGTARFTLPLASRTPIRARNVPLRKPYPDTGFVGHSNWSTGCGSLGFSCVTNCRAVVLATSSSDVQVEQISNENSHISLKVTVSADFCKQSWNSVIKDAAAQAQVPGYRKGAKVPESLLIGFLGGKQEVTRLAVERALRDSLPDALACVASEAISDSERIESSSDELIKSFSLSAPFTYRVGVDMPAKLEFISPYNEMVVTVPTSSSPDSEAQKVEDLIMQGRKDQGCMRIVADRGMKKGDSVVIDLELYRSGSREPLQGATRKSYQFDTGKANAAFLPGVIEAMEGMVANEERILPITFPRDWEAPQLAGGTFDGRIVLKELFEFDLADESDSLAASLCSGAQSMSDLRERLARAVSQEMHAINQSRIDAAISEELVRITKADIPWSIIQAVGQQKYQAKILELQSQDKIAPEVLEQLATPAMLQNYIKTNKQLLEDTAKALMAIETIFGNEKMVITEDETMAQIKDSIADFEDANLEYDKNELLDQAAEQLTTKKVLDWLRETVKVNMLPYDAAREAAAI